MNKPMNKANIDHILRAASAVTNEHQFVLVGSGAVIASLRNVPYEMLNTDEIDIYVENTDMEALITGTLGPDSMFHRTWNYYADGGPDTSVMPLDWKSRASIYTIPDGSVTAICPSVADIAVAKLCAARDKDRQWLRAGAKNGLFTEQALRDLFTKHPMPASAHPPEILSQLLDLIFPKSK
jgi:hypothetical protein